MREAACEPVLEVDNSVRFCVGTREGLVGVHLVPACGELGEESGCCEYEKDEVDDDGEIVDGEEWFHTPRDRYFRDVRKKRSPFFSEEEENAQDERVGEGAIEESRHAGKVDDQREYAEAEEDGENETLEKAFAFEPEAANETASDREAGERDKRDEENRSDAVYRDADIGLEEAYKKYPTCSATVEDDDEIFHRNRKRIWQASKPRHDRRLLSLKKRRERNKEKERNEECRQEEYEEKGIDIKLPVGFVEIKIRRHDAERPESEYQRTNFFEKTFHEKFQGIDSMIT